LLCPLETDSKMAALKALVCLLSLSLGSCMSAPSTSLSSTLSSLFSSPASSLGSLSSSPSAATTWDREFTFTKLGLDIKLKYVEAAAPLKGAQAAVTFAVPEALWFFTRGVTQLQANVFFAAPQITEGLFDLKMGFKVVRNSVPLEGTITAFRRMESGKYITKVFINDKEVVVADVTIDADMKNKVLITATYAGETYSLRINRVRGTSYIIAVTYGGTEYSTVINPSFVLKKIMITGSINKKAIHNIEIVYNPISTEMGLYISGNVNGVVDCRFILQRDLKFAQVILSHNKHSIFYFNADGKIQMKKLIPDFFKYAINYDILEGKFGEGKAKVNFNALDDEKLLSVSVAPKAGHAYDFEMKAKMDTDYSFEVTHELTSDRKILYTASHKHTVAFNTAEKWMSLQKDKFVIPKTSTIYTFVHGTYIGDVLSNMQRKMAINIDWRTKTGVVPKVDYKDSIMVNALKHFTISLNTMKTPFDLHLRYPRGPTVLGHNLGLLNLLGQDSVNCGVTYTPKKQVVIATDIDNMKISLTLPNWSLSPAAAMEITKTTKNEKVFELALIKQGPLAFKINGFASIMTGKLPYVCETDKPTCHWSSVLNVDVDFSQRVSGLVPINIFTFSVTRDIETILEVQQSVKTSPYFIRVNCPKLLPKMLDVTINHVENKEMTIQVADFIPGTVVVDIVGTKHVIKYEGIELATVDIDLTRRIVSVGLAMFQQNIFTLTYATENIFNNKATIDLHLPVLGEVMVLNTDWAITAVNDWTVKTNVVVTLPVVGKMTKNMAVTVKTTLTKGSISWSCNTMPSSGLITYVPPMTSTLAASYDLTTTSMLELSCVSSISKSSWSIFTKNTSFNINNQMF